MATVTPALANQVGAYGSEQFRRATAMLAPNEQDSIGGVSDWVVTQRGAGANMSVDISEGRGFVKGDDNAYQGLYVCETRGVTNLAIPAAHASLGRIDLITARVRDNAYSVPGNSWTFEVIQGTPSASPAVPANVNSSYVIAQLFVGPGVTSIVNANLDDHRFWSGSSWGTRTPAPIGCRLRRAAGQSGFTALTWTSVIWDTKDDDPYTFCGIPSATVGVPTGMGGPYSISAWVNKACASEYIRIVAGGREYQGDVLNDDIALSFLNIHVPCIYLNAGDTVSVSTRQAIGSQTHTGFFEMWRIATPNI